MVIFSKKGKTYTWKVWKAKIENCPFRIFVIIRVYFIWVNVKNHLKNSNKKKKEWKWLTLRAEEWNKDRFSHAKTCYWMDLKVTG